MGTNIALYGEQIQANAGFEVRALCKLEYMDKREAVE